MHYLIGIEPKQVNLEAMLKRQNTAQATADDFVAAFLHAGIPPAKLLHPSITGLLRKYTSVSGLLDRQFAKKNNFFCCLI